MGEQLSTKFDYVEKHFGDILRLIDDNQNIKRYVAYLSDSPLDNTSEQPDIEDSLINNNIILGLYDPKICDEVKIRLFFNPKTLDYRDESIGRETYVLDIVVPNNYWIVPGQRTIRVIRIASELSKMIDGKSITGVGKVKVTYGNMYSDTTNFKYQGMSVFIQVTSSVRR